MPFASSSWGRPATSRATARPSAPRISCALYAWELESGRRNWRLPVRGGVVSGDARLNAFFAEQDLGLVYALEPMVVEQLRTRRLKVVLERYAPTVPGFFL